MKQHQQATNKFFNSQQYAGLVDFIKEQVPPSSWEITPVWLKAPAGLRMLESSQSDAILRSVQSYLGDKANSPFLFRDSFARIISGNEEGGFGWIAFNYLQRVIGPKRIPGVDPYAVVEMGGASLQVSQRAPSQAEADLLPKDNKFSFSIEGETFTLYTHSYLGFGGEQGREALNSLLMAEAQPNAATVSDPCLNEGFSRAAERREVYEGVASKVAVQGAATSSSCPAALSRMFQTYSRTSCDNTLGPFSFGCVHQPAFVAKSSNVLLFENFYYLSSGLAVKPADGSSATTFPLVTTPAAISDAAEAVCSKEWSSLQTAYPLDSQGKDNNVKWCFLSSYASTFLTKGLGLDPNKKVTISKNVGSSEIEWALGAAYREAAYLLQRTNLRPT